MPSSKAQVGGFQVILFNWLLKFKSCEKSGLKKDFRHPFFFSIIIIPQTCIWTDTSNENYPGSFIQEEEKIVRLAYKEEKKVLQGKHQPHATVLFTESHKELVKEARNG